MSKHTNNRGESNPGFEFGKAKTKSQKSVSAPRERGADSRFKNDRFAELLDRLHENFHDFRAMEELLDRVAPFVYSSVCRFCNTRDQIWVASEVMSKVGMGVLKFRGGEVQFATYAYAIARNHCYKYVNRREMPLLGQDLLNEYASRESDPCQGLMDHERLNALECFREWVRNEFPVFFEGGRDRGTYWRNLRSLREVVDHAATTRFPFCECKTCARHNVTRRLTTQIQDADLGRSIREDMKFIIASMFPDAEF